MNSMKKIPLWGIIRGSMPQFTVSDHREGGQRRHRAYLPFSDPQSTPWLHVCLTKFTAFHGFFAGYYETLRGER